MCECISHVVGNSAASRVSDEACSNTRKVRRAGGWVFAPRRNSSRCLKGKKKERKATAESLVSND